MHKSKSVVILLGLSSFGLAGCQQKQSTYVTPANVMPLVKTGVGTNNQNNQNGTAKYNANNANVEQVEQEDLTKVEFMPKGYQPIGGKTQGGILANTDKITNTGTSNQSENATVENLKKHKKVKAGTANNNQLDDGFTSNQDSAAKKAAHTNYNIDHASSASSASR